MAEIKDKVHERDRSAVERARWLKKERWHNMTALAKYGFKLLSSGGWTVVLADKDTGYTCVCLAHMELIHETKTDYKEIPQVVVIKENQLSGAYSRIAKEIADNRGGRSSCNNSSRRGGTGPTTR